MSAITFRKHDADGESFIRFIFPHGDEEMSYASNVLIEFCLFYAGDDRICPHGMEGNANYIDIPTEMFDDTLAELEAQEGGK